MSKRKAKRKPETLAVALRHPDKLLLVYGEETVELKLDTDFSNYVVTIDKDRLPFFKPYLADEFKVRLPQPVKPPK